MKTLAVLLSTFTLIIGIAGGTTGCGLDPSQLNKQLPDVGDSSGADGVVIKGRTVYQLSTGSQPLALSRLLISSAIAASALEPISTVLAASTSFAINTSLFTVPSSPVPFEVNDFGFLQIADLKDNKLDACGGKKCGTAMIRIYTTGTAGSGLWNASGEYGAPITAGQAGNAAGSTVGLNASGAAVVHQITIPKNKHVLKLSDFTNPKYGVQVDFTNAGAGTYTTTLVVEYALAP